MSESEQIRLEALRLAVETWKHQSLSSRSHTVTQTADKYVDYIRHGKIANY